MSRIVKYNGMQVILVKKEDMGRFYNKFETNILFLSIFLFISDKNPQALMESVASKEAYCKFQETCNYHDSVEFVPIENEIITISDSGKKIIIF